MWQPCLENSDFKCHLKTDTAGSIPAQVCILQVTIEAGYCADWIKVQCAHFSRQQVSEVCVDIGAVTQENTPLKKKLQNILVPEASVFSYSGYISHLLYIYISTSTVLFNSVSDVPQETEWRC